MSAFQRDLPRPQSPLVVPLIEMQYDYYEPPQTYQQTQQQIPQKLPIYPGRQVDPLPIIAIVGILGLFGLFAFLAYLKR